MPNKPAFHRIIIGSLALYALGAGVLILQNPGLQYDEALLVLGAVHMRHSQHELTLAHDPNTWVCPGGRCFSLMTTRYVGAIKEYICLPLFAAFGPGAVILRLVSASLGALGIWGIARFMFEHISAPAAAAAAVALAINPSYVDLTVFDNGTVAIWMGALGVLCLAIGRYLRCQSSWAAFWLGASMGLGVWARANFVWLLIAMSAAAVIVLGRRIFVPLCHWASLIAGGVVGGAPFLVYQVVSRGGTWEALDMFHTGQTLRQRLIARLIMFAETILSDREHRAMWDGPSIPAWQVWLFPCAVLAACLLCLLSRYVWARGSALCFLFLGAFLFFSKMIVAEHHLIALVPPAAVVTVLAACIVARYRVGRVLVAALAAVYLSSALVSQAAAVEGLARSGGVGPWSDAVFALSEYLQDKYPDRDIKILDWGLQNNLYVLSDGKIHSRAFHGDITRKDDPRWIGEIRRGGIFLMNGPANRQFPVASLGFLETLAAARPTVRRFDFPQRSGVPYATIVDIEPNTVQDSAPTVTDQRDIGTQVMTGDPRFAKQLKGFNGIEPGGWRWTTREFSVTLRAPAGSEHAGARLTLQLFVPESSIKKLGPMTLTARLGNRTIGSETYAAEGQYSFSRDLEPSWLKPGANRVDFTLDKCVQPSIEDGRELGVVVPSASLEPR